MYVDSEITTNYRQGEVIVRYNMQFGIAPYIKDLLAKYFFRLSF